MHKFFQILGIAVSAVFLFYLALPGPSFPEPPPDATQSVEPADSETPLRRAYFTNFTRQETVDFYRESFGKTALGITLPSIRLNYPPEDAYVLVRDQTRSTGLEEIAHPFRESIYLNFFEPKDPKDDVWYKGVDFRQKITISHHASSVIVRLPLGILTVFTAFVLIKEWLKIYA